MSVELTLCVVLSVINPVVGGVADRDDIHLILEYKAGESWGPFTSPRANRWMTTNLVMKIQLQINIFTIDQVFL